MGSARISVLADTMEIDIVRKKELLMERPAELSVLQLSAPNFIS